MQGGMIMRAAVRMGDVLGWLIEHEDAVVKVLLRSGF